MAVQASRAARRADRPESVASTAELTGERFIRSVALALRAQWEGDDHFQAASHLADADVEVDADWAEFRADSEAAILAYLDVLERNGFRIVRNLS